MPAHGTTSLAYRQLRVELEKKRRSGVSMRRLGWGVKAKPVGCTDCADWRGTQSWPVLALALE